MKPDAAYYDDLKVVALNDFIPVKKSRTIISNRDPQVNKRLAGRRPFRVASVTGNAGYPGCSCRSAA